jgi:formate hydrogenlyase subunit 6/NADH:ubiquinone oxidoreductase subunit I
MIGHSGFLALVDELAGKNRIIGPVARQERYFYEEVDRAAAVDLGFNYCVFSPRRFLFPPTETLFKFNRGPGRFAAEAVLDERPTAFIGVHPCDINAIRLLDRVFEKDHPDEHYLCRRRHTLIVGLDCPKPCTTGVFCADMKTNDAAEGFDVMLYPLSGGNGKEPRYGAVFGTPAGREWILYSHKSAVPTAADERVLDQYQRSKIAAFPREIRTPSEELPSLLDRSYDSLLWEATARRCYSCGSCNLSCPTCYCFNIFDELDMTLTGGERKREWDGCQLPKFAEVAGAHNFRGKAASRLRHRIYRKAKWVRDLSGLPGCVGCARCDRACTAKINSVEIYNQLAEEV